jgi:multidrug efflux pump subunit AcrB
MKGIITHFIKYPVAVNIVILGFFILGAMGMFSMRSSFFPLQESKIVNVTVAYPGASPEEMEEGVVLKIEDNLRGLIGVERFTSTSSENTARIVVEAQKGYDIDVLLADVKNAVDKVPSFPVEMEPPVVSKQETLTNAVDMVVTGKKGVGLSQLKAKAREIESDLRNIDGISQVTISGFPDEEINIAVKEEALRSYGLTFTEIAQAIRTTNILVTGGSIKTAEEEYLIRVKNRSYYAKELEKVIVRSQADGSKVRLADVAQVRDRFTEIPDRSFYNSSPSVEINISTTNTEDLVRAVDKTLAYIEEYNSREQATQIAVVSDRSIVIRQRTELLLRNGVQGILLVLLFLSIFLRPRLAAWVAFGLPISFMGMFMLVDYFDVTINVLSLFGMIIVIGILVDDGIVISENIFHHYEKGKNRIQAAIDGTMEVVPAITSAILTTMIAFSMFFFLDGRVGEFFSEVTVVVMLTLGFSLLEAFIILPAHVAHSKALSKEQKTYRINRWGDRVMSWMRDRLYLPTLRWCLSHTPIALAILVASLMLTMGALQGGTIRGTFFPAITSDKVSIILTMPQGVNPAETDSIITMMEQRVWEVNEDLTDTQTDGLQVVENVVRKVGPGNANASLTVNLLPGERRDKASSEITKMVFDRIGPVPQAESLVIDGGSNFGGSPVSVALLSYNVKDLKAAKEELKAELRSDPMLRDVVDNDPAGIKEIRLVLKNMAYSLGLTIGDVMTQVRAGFNGLQVQRFQRGQDEIIVWARYDLEGRSSIRDLDEMRILTPQGGRVPLKELAQYSIARGDITINHLDGKREIRVSADLKDPKASAADIVARLRNEFIPELQTRYTGLSALYEGQNREAERTTRSAKAVIPVILLLIYLVIGFTFRSFSQPLLLLLMIPFSLIGVGWGHWIHDFPVNILSMLGVIALIGIVVNDGLVFISKFNGYLKEGMHYRDAITAAGRSRFRAIFLTSVTTIAGLSPLIFETSRQAQFLIPMAISIAYGIGIGTILTLILLPMMLQMTNSLKVHLLWLWEGKRPSPEEVERAVQELESERMMKDNAHEA